LLKKPPSDTKTSGSTIRVTEQAPQHHQPVNISGTLQQVKCLHIANEFSSGADPHRPKDWPRRVSLRVAVARHYARISLPLLSSAAGFWKREVHIELRNAVMKRAGRY